MADVEITPIPNRQPEAQAGPVTGEYYAEWMRLIDAKLDHQIMLLSSVKGWISFMGIVLIAYIALAILSALI